MHPDELPKLFNTILINVTSFFRNAPAWEQLWLHEERMLSNREGRIFRAWSAECASGEETFFLAVTMTEIVGIETVSRR